jgi:hypothetical protein
MGFLRSARRLALGVVTALVVAVIGTIAHQTSLGRYPFGLFLAMFFVLLAALQLRKNKLSSWGFAVALGLTLFVIGQAWNQDAMIPANLYGTIWAYGSIALAALVAMWPSFSSR